MSTHSMKVRLLALLGAVVISAVFSAVAIVSPVAVDPAVAEVAAKRSGGKAKKGASAVPAAKPAETRKATETSTAATPVKEKPAASASTPPAPAQVVGAPATSSSDASNPFASALGLKDKDGSGGDGPIEIRSKSVSLDAKERVFTYRGNVEVIRNDLRITSQLMTGRYDEANRLQTIVCERDVVITRGVTPTGPALRATSNRAVYQVPKAIIELTEGPQLFRSGNALSADKVLIYVNEDRSEAEGNVQVKVVKSEDPARGKTLAQPGTKTPQTAKN